MMDISVARMYFNRSVGTKYTSEHKLVLSCHQGRNLQKIRFRIHLADC